MNNQKSFTLIELLVVIVIIGILAGVIMISTSSSIDKANIAKVKVFENSIDSNLAANMVSRWKLDEIDTTLNPNTTPDAWGSNTGSLYGTDGPQLKLAPECVTDGCFEFNGIDNKIMIANSADLNISDDITVSAWIKQDVFDHSSYHIVLESVTDYGWFFGTVSGKVCWLIGRQNLNSWNVSFQSYGILTNGWNHIVGTYKNGLGTIYLNGSFVKDLLGVAEKTKDPNGFKIGLQNINNYTFDGLIDDVKIYNSVLSTSQIKQNYIAGLNSLLIKGAISESEFKEKVADLSSNK